MWGLQRFRTVVAPLLHYIGQVFSCLTGDRDSRPNVGEERSILGTATGPTPASRASVSLLRSAWVPN